MEAKTKKPGSKEEPGNAETKTPQTRKKADESTTPRGGLTSRIVPYVYRRRSESIQGRPRRLSRSSKSSFERHSLSERPLAADGDGSRSREIRRRVLEASAGRSATEAYNRPRLPRSMGAAATIPTISLTIITNHKGLAAKVFRLNGAGLEKTSAAAIYEGEFRRVEVHGLAGVLEAHGGLNSNQAATYGVPDRESGRIVTHCYRGGNWMRPSARSRDRPPSASPAVPRASASGS